MCPTIADSLLSLVLSKTGVCHGSEAQWQCAGMLFGDLSIWTTDNDPGGD